MAVKYIFVTGGVVSGLGKGITVASIGRLLKARGMKIAMLKLDPYININPGHMSPNQHGEIYVTDDGTVTDLGIGHYERFTGESFGREVSATAGKIYWNVLSKERAGDYGGGTVQIVPHITNEIKKAIYDVSKHKKDADVVIVEIGGTVGDIEGLPFLEAIRQVASEVGRNNCAYVQVALIPYLSASGEIKTKPVQHSVKELLGIGIQPDAIVCRTKKPINKEIKDKIGLFCNISGDAVISDLDSSSVYEIPLEFEKQGLCKIILDRLGIEDKKADLSEWEKLAHRFKEAKREINVAIVGKDAEAADSYISIKEALTHSAVKRECAVKIKLVDAHEITDENVCDMLKGADAIVSAGGFGTSAAAGQMETARYARENDVPFLAISLGAEMAALEFAKNVCGIDAGDVIVCRREDEQANITDLMAHMKKGAYVSVLKDGPLKDIYKTDKISERHLHEYEINKKYYDILEENGMIITALSLKNSFADAFSIKGHRWYNAVKFNPQFKSRIDKTHVIFDSLIDMVLCITD